MKHILVIRFSAFGDIAISIPVIKNIIDQNKDAKIIILTKNKFKPIFSLLPEIEIFAPDFKTEFTGVLGIFKLYKSIRKNYKIDLVIDLHQVLRTKILSLFFKLAGIPFFKINKGRKEKRNLIQRRNKTISPLKTSSQRYIDVFLDADLKINFSNTFKINDFLLNNKVKEILNTNNLIKIGIAPFAFYEEKTYPIQKMEQVIKMLIETKTIYIFIFGGGDKEKLFAKGIEEKYENVHSVIGSLNLEEELSLMNQMQLMLTMDSANMHLAGLTQTKILSIWGATHPFAGFTTRNFAKEADIIQIPVSELSCRPCSVFGNKKCFRNDLACMNKIEPIEIKTRIINSISK